MQTKSQPQQENFFKTTYVVAKACGETGNF